MTISTLRSKKESWTLLGYNLCDKHKIQHVQLLLYFTSVLCFLKPCF